MYELSSYSRECRVLRITCCSDTKSREGVTSASISFSNQLHCKQRTTELNPHLHTSASETRPRVKDSSRIQFKKHKLKMKWGRSRVKHGSHYMFKKYTTV